MNTTQPKQLTPQDQTAIVRANLTQVEAMVAHELSLIGSRMTWFAISQSFLFGAYATIATDPVRLRQAFGSTGTTQPEVGQATITVFLILLPVVGFFFALAAWRSVHAASVVLSYLDPCRGALLIRYKCFANGHGV